MRVKTILSLAALCIALAACGKPDQPAQTSNASTSALTTPAPATAERNAAAMPPDHAANSKPPPVSQEARRYLCPQGPNACRVSGPLVANSDAEAQWLWMHGYPTEDELARLETLNLDQLKAESQAGNKAATVIYGKKTAVAGQFYKGIGILRRAAVAGNLYAYYGLSDVYISDTEHKNLVDSMAHLRLAYLLGDAKASAVIASRDLSSVENVVADERAASLHKTFSKYQRPSPRPLE
ncbi:hypothetical protein [Xanthomonas floridensis]|uniref:Uncharacterized protein n=1 Tax=Xanthomonas floridensis TaxID=1843580 RepID=A0A1A9M907_9XANT|nr:hypothetical protein [Xanthomonas floridensis]MEA5125670.1 hypothetical protein [Xanthomonas floridensis]MEA5133545.1 hypothetical protein [Xanthomonas floridensis]OAG66708.1 hypothetical protein A7D17_20460 [Xanthomonas floridensis]